MKRGTTRFLAIVLLVLLAAGCGTGQQPAPPVGTSQPQPSTSQPEGPSPQPSSDGGPRYGGTLVHAIASDPHHLMPPLTSSSITAAPGSAAIEGLVTLRWEKDRVVPKPALAESWDISPDGLTYTFHLRKGVKWHDGQPFTAEDVKFTIEEVVIPYHPLGKRVWGNLDSITVPDPETVIIKLKEPFALLLNMLGVGYGFGGIIPKHLYEGTDIPNNPYNGKPVGTGPFKFVKWDRGSQIEFERNTGYWDPERPYLDRVVFRIVPDSTTLVGALLAGQVDQVDWTGVPYGQLPRLQADPSIKFSDVPQGAAGLELIKFNLRHPILKHKLVRQAIAYAIDTDLVHQVVFSGFSHPATAHVSSALGLDNWNENQPLSRYGYDPDKANQLLDQAGFPRGADGTRFKLTHTFATLQDFQTPFATLLVEQLGKVGIKVEPRPMEYAAFLETVYTKWDFEMMAHTMNTGPQPEFYTSRLYVSSNIKQGVTFSNAEGYENPDIDSLFAAVPVEPDQKKRAQILDQIQETLAEDLPLLPIWEVHYPLPSRAEFHNTGLSPLAVGGEFNWNEIWWEKADRTSP